ncbi:MAG: Ig-like domain-containing protein, partial [Taibaiella sp.]|nr:Ig-like domain-containing protein [Taibaiella sp.]
VSGTNANGCVNTATKTVTVNASPTIVAGADATICRGASTALTASGGTTYTWAPNTALSATTGASVTASPTTTVTYTVTGSNGCVGTATQTVSVNPLPTIGAGAGVAICNGASTTLNATGGDTYLWSPGTSLSATTGSSVVATPTIATTYTVSGTDANGCVNTATTTVSVNASPTISAGTDEAICLGTSTVLTATGGTTYTWTPAAGLSATTGASVTANPTTTTTYTVTGTIAGGCNSTATKTVTVNALPTISAGSDVAICQGTGTTLSATGGTSYTWSPNTALSATTGSSITASPTTTVTYTVTGTDANGCNNAASKQVSVNALPTINAGSGVVICTGASTTLSATGGATYTWAPGASLTATTGSSVLASPTTTVTYTVTGTDGNGCTNTATTIVSVDVTPDAGIISGEDLVSIGAATALSSTQPGGTWSSGNANATVGSATGIVTGISGGTVLISYTYTNACGTDYATKTMTVNTASSVISGSSQLCVNSTTTYLPPLPGGTWSSSNPAVIGINAATGVASGMNFGPATISYTLGTTFYTKNVTVSNTIPAITGSLVACNGLTTVLSHSIEGGIWSSGSPWHATINSGNGTLTAIAPGVSLISYTLGSDCHAISVVTVNPLPGAITGSLEICQGNSLALYSSTFSGTWVSTTASVATIGSATGIATGISTGTTSITYTGPNGCFATAIVTVNAAIGSITGAPSVCVGGTNSTLVSPVSGGTWSSSNVSIANINATTGLLTGVGVGNANISYTTTPGCYAVIVATVNILDTITGANNVCNGATITLANGTSGGVWSSSNVSKATVGAATGIVTGISTGTVIITYTQGSCYRTRTVNVTPSPAAITGAIPLCIGSTTTLSTITTGGIWSSSDITKATVNSTTGLTTGIATGTAIISYTAGGCSSTVTVTVGTLAAISGTASVCVGSTTTLTHITSGGVWSSNNISKATIGAGTGIVTGVSAGTARITYTVGGACSQTMVITVNALPNNITGVATLCKGATTMLSTTSTGGAWSSSAPAVATIGTNGAVTGISAGTATISYQLSTGCVNTRVVTINMTPDAITGTTSVCIGSTTTLASATSGGVWSSYFTSRATINATTGVATGISAGTTIISYSLGACRRTTVLTVSPTPAAITGILLVCNGSITALSSATTGGVWSSSDVTKATINAATGLVTGVGTGTSIISYVVGGCSRSAIVTVNAAAGAISGDGLVCVGQTNATLAGPGGSGTWSSSNTAVVTAHAVNGLLTGISTGTATITYSSSATCIATIVATVNAAVNNITGTFAICDGTTTTLANTTPDGTWSSSNTTIATVNAATGLVSGVSAGTTTISYRVSAGCYKATTFYINPLPLNINGSATVIIGGNTTLSSMGVGTWTSNNAAIATVGAGTGVVSGISLGATTITYTIATGCFRTKGITVVPARPDNNNYTTIETAAILKIYPNPTAGVFTIEAPSNGTFTVFTIDGKQLVDYQISIPLTTVILPPGIAAGVYMCRYTAVDGSTTIVRIIYEP